MNSKKQWMLGCLWAASSFVLCAGAAAQSEGTWTHYCQQVGNNAPEPVGDRPGHAIQTGEFTCNTIGGPMDGALVTGTYVWEWDKTNVTVLGGIGITRKPGAVSVWQDMEQKVTLLMDNEKVTGITGTGRGRILMGSGPAAGFAGKTYSYSWKGTGFGQWAMSVRME